MFFVNYKFVFEDGNEKEMITGDIDIKNVIKELEKRKEKKVSKFSIKDGNTTFNFEKENDVLYLISKDNLKFKI